MREKERSCCSQSFYCTQLFKKRARKCIGIRKGPRRLLSNRETEGEEVVDDVSEGVKLRTVDIENFLSLEGASVRRILCLEAT